MARKLNHPKRVEAWDVEVGRRIRARRIECGLSQEDLGKGLGVSFQQIQKYEKGVNRVSAGRLQRVGEVLNVPMTFFYSSDVPEAMAGSRGMPTKLFGLLDARDSQHLVTAFNRISDRKVRRSLVALVDRIQQLGEIAAAAKRSRGRVVAT